MELKSVVRFKNPREIDWEATEKQIVHEVWKHSDKCLSHRALQTAQYIIKLRRLVRELGGADRLYQTIQQGQSLEI